MRFSIVIPTHNNIAELERCLASIELLNEDAFEVFVCIDGSTDSTQEIISKNKYTFPFQLLEHSDKKNHGRSATRNLALNVLQGKYVLFLDSDMECAPDLLEQHLKVLANQDNISIGAILYLNLSENVWAKYASERGFSKYAHNAEIPANYFVAANTAVCAEWVKALGGFDEAIQHYGGEDMEFGYRVNEAYQPKMIYNKLAKVETKQEKDLDTALLQLEEYGRTGLRYITQKYPSLKSIYWVNKIGSDRFKDQLFEFLTITPFRKFARFCVRVLPYFLQKLLINYLVICAVHKGYQTPEESV